MCWSHCCYLWLLGQFEVERGICSAPVGGCMVQGGGVPGLSVAGRLEGVKGPCGYDYMLGFIGWVYTHTKCIHMEKGIHQPF